MITEVLTCRESDMSNHSARLETLRAYISDQGLKNSKQREIVAEAFFESGDHMRVDELLAVAREIDAKISQATVYRTMKLLVDCGLAEARHFHDGQARYEPSDVKGEHHDHLICIDCGKIVEFVDPQIEELQDKVAEKYGFTITDHKMELYGRCNGPDCAKKSS